MWCRGSCHKLNTCPEITVGSSRKRYVRFRNRKAGENHWNLLFQGMVWATRPCMTSREFDPIVLRCEQRSHIWKNNSVFTHWQCQVNLETWRKRPHWIWAPYTQQCKHAIQFYQRLKWKFKSQSMLIFSLMNSIVSQQQLTQVLSPPWTTRPQWNEPLSVAVNAPSHKR